MLYSLNSQNQYNPSFGSIKQDMVLAEKILKKHKQAFPYTKSSSYMFAKILQHSNDDSYIQLSKKMARKIREYNSKIIELRNMLSDDLFASISFDYRSKMISKFVKKTKTGNCGEQNSILQRCFLKKGIKPQPVIMEILDSETKLPLPYKNHSFLLFNLSPKAVIENPKTWGPKAFVADAYCNIVMKAKDALDYYKDFFSLDFENEIRNFVAINNRKNLK